MGFNSGFKGLTTAPPLTYILSHINSFYTFM